MKMYNHELESFVGFLMEEEVSGKESRMRSRFLKLAQQQVKQIEEDRMELIKQFSYQDTEGNPQVDTREDGSTVFKLKDTEGFTKEYGVLMFEEFIIEATEDKKDMLETITNIVLNTSRKFKGEEALAYDRYCEIVES
jgi:hypothetical protein